MRVRSFAVALCAIFVVSTSHGAPVSWKYILVKYGQARQALARGNVKAAHGYYAQAARLPAGTPRLQREAITRVNYHRMYAMLVPVMPSKAVARAAQAHAHYLALHTKEGALSLTEAHREVPGRQGFTGRGVGDRLRHQGFRGGSTEVVSAVTDPVEAVDHLTNTVYHRSGILRPEARYMGFGASSRAVIDLAWQTEAPGDDDWIYYPGNWQQDVPPRFPGGETPEPLPGRQYPVGPPLSVGTSLGPPQITRALLTGPDGPVELKVLDQRTAPKAKMLGNYVYFVPLTALKENSRYQCTLEGVKPGGRQHRQRWAFRTGSTVPGEELWSVKITKLRRTPQTVRLGATIVFTAEIEANRPDEVILRWTVNDTVIKEGLSRRLRWKVRRPGTYTIDAYAYYPKNEQAFGRRVLQLTIPGAQDAGVGASTAFPSKGLLDPSAGNRTIAVKLDFSPAPPWTKGTKVELGASTVGITGEVQFSFSCDGTVFATTKVPKAQWVADGRIDHQFAVKVDFDGGSVTRKVRFSRQ